mmetsp:Transcript_7256/g.22101  ORF Transcript_7256/g.22101 Transcript_7256/m.22101 type:complete len:275 (-) Transcript_7256:106-930(-)
MDAGADLRCLAVVRHRYRARVTQHLVRRGHELVGALDGVGLVMQREEALAVDRHERAHDDVAVAGGVKLVDLELEADLVEAAEERVEELKHLLRRQLLGHSGEADDVQKQDGHIVVLQRERLQVGQALFGVGAAHELEHVAGEHVLEHAQLRLRQLRHAQLAQRARSDVRLHHQHRLHPSRRVDHRCDLQLVVALLTREWHVLEARGVRRRLRLGVCALPHRIVQLGRVHPAQRAAQTVAQRATADAAEPAARRRGRERAAGGAREGAAAGAGK